MIRQLSCIAVLVVGLASVNCSSQPSDPLLRHHHGGEDATTFDLAGKITDEAGKPIGGVSITIQSSRRQASNSPGAYTISLTDHDQAKDDGSFEVTVADALTATLRFEKAGYEAAELRFTGLEAGRIHMHKRDLKVVMKAVK